MYSTGWPTCQSGAPAFGSSSRRCFRRSDNASGESPARSRLFCDLWPNSTDENGLAKSVSRSRLDIAISHSPRRSPNLVRCKASRCSMTCARSRDTAPRIEPMALNCGPSSAARGQAPPEYAIRPTERSPGASQGSLTKARPREGGRGGPRTVNLRIDMRFHVN